MTSSPGSPHHPGCAHLFTRFRTSETTVPRCITVAEWELDYRGFIPPAPAPGNPHFVLANRSLKVSSALGIAHFDYLESLTILEALTYPQGFEAMKYCGFEVSPCGVLIWQQQMTVHSIHDSVGNRPPSQAWHTGETNRQNGRRLFYVRYQRPPTQTAPSQHSPRARLLPANTVASSVVVISRQCFRVD
jgi:hypothetical protein